MKSVNPCFNGKLFGLFGVSLNHLHLLRNRIPRCVNFVHTLRDCCYAGASNFEFQNFLVLMEFLFCLLLLY